MTPDYLVTQIFNGLVNGGFYALLALGLSIIFGMLRIVNFAHGATYMLGAFVAYYGALYLHLPFFAALVVGPVVVGVFGLLLETLLLRRLYNVDPLYNLLFTFAVVLMLEDGMRLAAGALGSPYETPAILAGSVNLGFVEYPTYRLFIIAVCAVVCLATYLVIERSPLGARIRAATEKPELTRAFGIDTRRLVSGVFAFGVALAALAGVLNAPNTNVTPTMGDGIIINTFAIVVIGGLGSIRGSIIAAFALGLIQALGAIFYPPISNTLIFIVMVLVIMFRPQGLFGTAERTAWTLSLISGKRGALVGGILLLAGILLPLVHGVYIVFAIDLVCFALVAVAFDLLLGFTGLLSFGHALFWGGAGYVATILVSRGVTSFPLAILAGVAYAALLSLAVGAISVRRSGIFFAMITLAIGQIQYFLAFQLSDLTGGENGLTIDSRGKFFGISLENDFAYYYLVLAIAALGTAFAVRVVTSPFGAVLAAMRENEVRAQSIGYDVTRFKLAAFVISGTLAGLAGALYALGNKLSGLEAVDWHLSGAIVIMTILGGIGTIYGPIVGAAIYESLDFFVSKTPIGDKTNIVMGLVFAIVIMFARRGLVGEILYRVFAKKPMVEDEDRPEVMVVDVGIKRA